MNVVSYHERDYAFGQTLMRLRTTIGLTQADLARLLGITRKAVSRWEVGESYPKTAHLQALLAYAIEQHAFASGQEEEEIRAIWHQARQKVPLDERWLDALRERIAASSIDDRAQRASEGGERLWASRERGIWMMPSLRNPHFTGRQIVLEHLHQQFAPVASLTPHHVAQPHTQILKGLGGIGKTQIAIEYAYQALALQRYAYTIWINAVSEETALASFAAFAEQVTDLRAKEEKEQRVLTDQILRWLERCQEPWLLIYDNADDLTWVPAYLPKAGWGGILLTTRASASVALAPSIHVDVLPPEDATRLLLQRAGRDTPTMQERAEASVIAQLLGYFPLALDQAGAYLEETGCDLTEYVQLYQDHQQPLLARRGKHITGYADSIATTWQLAFEQIERDDQAAAECLQLCAFAAPDHIPEELLVEGARFWPETLQEAVADRWHFNQMLSTLLSFSLIKRIGQARQLSLHRLVQVVQQARLTPAAQRHWAERFVHAVHLVFPDQPKEMASWPTAQRLLDQALACEILIEQYQLFVPEAAELLYRAGNYLYERGLYSRAEQLLQRALALRERLLGPEHLDVATTLECLGTVSYYQGAYMQAESLFQQAQRIREHRLGLDHPEVASSLNGLANVYREQGKYAQAIPLFERALRIRELGLGPDYPIVAETLNGLANVYSQQGRHNEAEPLYQRALVLREQGLGEMHPDTAETLHDLATLQERQGNRQEALLLYQRALTIREQVLVPEHPQTNETRLCLAVLSQSLSQEVPAPLQGEIQPE